MIPFEWLFLSFIVGLVTNYLLALQYLKGLRGASKGISDWWLIACSIVWGTPILLFMYALFPEIRMEDMAHSRRLLISEIVLLLLQIALVLTLSFLGVISYDLPSSSESVSLSLFTFRF